MSIEIQFDRGKRRMKSAMLVSLIDIVFVVILFFLIAGRIEKFTTLPIDLPYADAGQALEEGPIEITLGKYDEILVNDDLYTSQTVQKRLRDELRVNPERIVTIKADARLEANKLVDFLELIQRAGGQNISVVTQEKRSG
jgi:biopolymer transport protein ExbD